MRLKKIATQGWSNGWRDLKSVQETLLFLQKNTIFIIMQGMSFLFLYTLFGLKESGRKYNEGSGQKSNECTV